VSRSPRDLTLVLLLLTGKERVWLPDYRHRGAIMRNDETRRAIVRAVSLVSADAAIRRDGIRPPSRGI